MLHKRKELSRIVDHRYLNQKWKIKTSGKIWGICSCIYL